MASTEPLPVGAFHIIRLRFFEILMFRRFTDFVGDIVFLATPPQYPHLSDSLLSIWTTRS
jgi:hypothetical protein